MSRTRTFSGLGVSPGIAIGRPVVVENRPAAIRREAIRDEEVAAEVQRLRDAAAAAAHHVAALVEEARAQVGPEYAAILEAHRLMFEDPTLLGEIERTIGAQLVSAEAALEMVVRELLSRFDQLADVYLRERRSDLIDVAAELQRALQGRPAPTFDGNGEDAVLVADDVPPSQALRLASRRVCGFASEAGGVTSHTTIIARSLGIPAVVGVTGVVAGATGARLVIVDGFEGHVLVDPDPTLVQVYRWRAEEHRQRQRELLKMADLPAVTGDGQRVRLAANLDLPDELPTALEAGAEGIGLFRSEFLFIRSSPELPGEEAQFEAYAALLDAFPEHPVTVRTFDLGGKKLARELLGSPESNPVLGLRGVRLCLQKPEFFRIQVRALLRAAARGAERLRILVPLVSCIEEIRTVRVFFARLAEELQREGHAVPQRVCLGAMIEVPAAAMIAEHLAREVDFFAVGTNDLTQYTLAVDRGNEQVSGLFRPFHPAVLRLLERVISAGRRAGIPVSLCGEMAADPLAVPVLVGLGLPEFSMHPQALPVVRNLVRSVSFREARRIAQRALSLPTAKAVEEFLFEQLSGLLSHLKVRIQP